MARDHIVEEIRQIREAYGEEFDFDLKAIADDLRRRQREAGRTAITLPPRRVTQGQRVSSAPR